MSKDFYWEVGGFDENFDGYYGTAQFFGIASEKIYPFIHLEDLWIDYVTDDIVADASTRGLKRTASIGERIEIRVKRSLRFLGLLPRKTLSNPYVRVGHPEKAS